MNRFLALLLFRAMQDAVSGADAGGASAAVAEPAPAEPTPAPSEPASQAVQPSEPVSTAEPDAMTGLEEAMKSLFPAEDPAQSTQTPAEGQPPAELAQFLSVSPYVDSAEKIPAAIAAANEVWDVVSGKAPASNLFEGLRTSNPQAFEAVMSSLIPYVEQVTGRTLQEPQAPQYDLNDPHQKRLYELEQAVAQDRSARAAEQEERRQMEWAETVTRANKVTTEKLSALLKGSDFEGLDDYMINRVAAKMPNGKIDINQVLSGDFKAIEKAFKEIQKEEYARVKQISDKMIARYRKQKSMVPATGTTGTSVQIGAKPGAPPPRKEGETAAEYGARLWKAGFGA